jgi:hypothetical protein
MNNAVGNPRKICGPVQYATIPRCKVGTEYVHLDIPTTETIALP